MTALGKDQIAEAPWRIDSWFPDLDKDLVAKLRIFHLELLRFNQSMNLISRRSELDADLLHFADCIIAAQHMLEKSVASRIFDIGSGNGLPGLIIALLDPKREVVLIDSNAKKIEFIRHIASKLDLNNVAVGHTRFEELKEGVIECAVSRGFASISKALILARKPMAAHAEYYHMKSNNWVREVAEIPTQICSFWAPSLAADYVLPAGGGKMSLVVAKRLA